MLLLALDTSTYQSSVALCTGERVYGEYTWYSGNNHSVELLNNIQRLMAECQMTMAQIDAIVVATGPGSFNGVRVALSTAKSLAFALRKPLVGVSTLDCIAAQQRHWQGPICSVLEAGRAELYTACYLLSIIDNEDGDVAYATRQLGDYQIFTPQQLVDYLHAQASDWLGIPGERQLPAWLFCGEISEASRQALRSHLHERAQFIYGPAAHRQASILAMLGEERLRIGKIDDPLLLEPLYLRRPSITKSARKQPLLGGTLQDSKGHTTTEREEGALRH